jgi:hypothetical protein
MKPKRKQKRLTGQHYDAATKVLMDTAAGAMLEAFLDIHAKEARPHDTIRCV